MFDLPLLIAVCGRRLRPARKPNRRAARLRHSGAYGAVTPPQIAGRSRLPQTAVCAGPLYAESETVQISYNRGDTPEEAAMHEWNVTPDEAVAIQEQWRTRVIAGDTLDPAAIQTVAGID